MCRGGWGERGIGIVSSENDRFSVTLTKLAPECLVIIFCLVVETIFYGLTKPRKGTAFGDVDHFPAINNDRGKLQSSPQVICGCEMKQAQLAM